MTIPPKKFILPGLALLVAGIILYFLYRFDPGNSMYAPKCTFYYLTGLYCPGCGSQRALHALLHGHIGAAFGYNPLLILMLPYLLLGLFVNIYTYLTGIPVRWTIFYNRYIIWIIFGIITIFWILKNVLIYFNIY